MKRQLLFLLGLIALLLPQSVEAASFINLPIAQAMSEYATQGSEGDVLKSQDAFAILSKNSSGQLVWKGSLHYMEQGRGYMLKRNAATPVSFSYPLYYGETYYTGVSESRKQVRLHESHTATTMTLVAKTEGVELQPGDRLSAYVDGQLCGMAEAAEDGVFYLSIGSAEQLPLVFCLERDGQAVAAVGNGMSYTADTMVGTPEHPTLISFTRAERYTDDCWYTLDGRRMERQPKQRGLYIHNGKIEFIR